MTNQDDKPQYDHFVEAARSLGCDESEAAFDEKLKKVARQKVKDIAAMPEKNRHKK